jgi:hypothetical protein
VTTERITAWTRLDYFQSSNSLDDEGNLVGATLQVKALPLFSDLLDAKIEARFQAPDLRGRPGYEPEANLLEGYLALHLPHADLRIGKQIVAWGRADGINPTDNLTPRNYRVLLPFDEDQRFGTWAARLDTYLPRSLTLTVFASPFFEPDQFPLPTAGLPVETRQPAHSLRDGQAALKLNHVGEDFDWSLSYYHGYNLLPAVNVVGSDFELYYNRMDVIGADCARNFGRFGFRSEIAYSLPSAHADVDPNATQRRLFWVTGLDRTFLENLNVNFQVFVRWMPDYQNPRGYLNAKAQAVGALNALILGQEKRVSHGITFRVSDQWFNNTLRTELFGVTNMARGDFYLRPLVTYDISDRLRVSVGANVYGGPHEVQYGVLKPDTGAFAELRYAF